MTDVAANNKRIVKNTLILYVRMVFVMLVNLYTSRLVLSALGIEDYGIYNVVGGIVAMFGFLNGAMATSTQRYLTFELGRGESKRLQNVFTTSVNIHILIAAVVVMLAETVGLWFLNTQMTIPGGRMAAAQWVYQLSIMATVVLFVSVPYTAVIIAHEKMSAFAYISIIDIGLKLAIAILLLKADMDRLILYAVLILCAQVIIRLIYGAYCRRHFDEARYKIEINANLFKEMFSYSAWNIWGGLASVCGTQGINILLNMFFNPAVNAARGVAVQIQSAVSQFATNFQTALNPQIIKYYAVGEMDNMHTLICRSSRFSFCLLFCISLPLFFETDMLLELWLKDVPQFTSVFIKLVLCISLISATANPLMTAAQATGKIKVYQSVLGGIQMAVLPAGYCALKLGGSPSSVFVSEIVVYSIAFVVRLLMLRGMINFRIGIYIKDVIIKCAIVALVASIITYVVNSTLSESAGASLIVCCVAVISAGICFLLLGTTRIERESIFLKLKRHINE